MTTARLEVGIALSAEEQGPKELVDRALAGEQAGFRTVAVSDHFHPWTSRQGQSSMVWPVLGAIASRSTQLRIGTAVTCPLLRTHPAIVAQAAATVAAMADGRFFLGLGTGENLNEHVLGQPWPPPEERLDRLEEAVEVIRRLWTGDKTSLRGTYYRVDRAQLFTLPSRPPPVYISAFGDKALRLAARIGDGLIGTSPNAEVTAELDRMAGRRLPKIAYDKVCWGPDQQAARELLHEIWPNSGLPPQLAQELATVELFENAVELVDVDTAVGKTPCGPDVEPYLELLKSYERAGYDTVCLHQVGPDHTGWLRFWQRELEPAWSASYSSAGAG